MFTSFTNTATFIASSFTSLSSDNFYLDYLEAGFYTYIKKGGDDKEEVMIWGAGTGVFKRTSSSGIPTDSIFNSPEKAGGFPYFSDTTPFLASYVLSPSYDKFSLASYPSSTPSDAFLLDSYPTSPISDIF